MSTNVECPRCVPLCGAGDAPWWRHEALCPARTPENPDTILDSVHLSQRQKEDALVAWLHAKVGKKT